MTIQSRIYFSVLSISPLLFLFIVYYNFLWPLLFQSLALISFLGGIRLIGLFDFVAGALVSWFQVFFFKSGVDTWGYSVVWG